MAEFHFVEDYERHVDALLKAHPRDEAMSLAVGGDYDRIGDIASDVLLSAGATSGQRFLDFGCGSGRVATALSRKVEAASYIGTDVVQSLLEYADEKTPDQYRFVLHREIGFPVEDASIDVAFAFSVFTHLLHSECYAYLTDIARVLAPGGRLVASFLEFACPAHWIVFEATLNAPHLNTFIERPVWELWADRAGLRIVRFHDSGSQVSGTGPLGQSCVVMEKI